MSEGAVLLARASGIQEWIVGRASELRVIRGGSMLLHRTFEECGTLLKKRWGDPKDDVGEDRPPASGWTLLAHASGVLSAIFAHREDAETAAQLVWDELVEHLPGLAVSVGVGAWPSAPPRSHRTGFQEALSNARAGQRRELALPSPYVVGTAVCEACGVASSIAVTGKGPRWRLCRGCSARASLVPDREETVAGACVTYQMDEIGSAAVGQRWRGYVAVICADGNGIGHRFAAVKTPLELRSESALVRTAVDRAVEEGLTRAVADFHHLAEAENRDDLPVNPLVKAGDDIRMVVPAAMGLSAAAGLTLGPDAATSKGTTSVRRSTPADNGARPFRACAGVVVCHHDLPFNVAHEHAEALLREAKRAARTVNSQDPPSHVAFSIETGSQVGPASTPVSASPYPSQQIAALLAATDRLAVPATALRNAVEGIGRRGRLAERAWLRFRRDLERDDRKVIDTLWDKLGIEHESPWLPGWGSERSPLGDVALWRSIRKRAR